MHAFDRQTDRRTDRNLIARLRLHSMQRGKNQSTLARITVKGRLAWFFWPIVYIERAMRPVHRWARHVVSVVAADSVVLPTRLDVCSSLAAPSLQRSTLRSSVRPYSATKTPSLLLANCPRAKISQKFHPEFVQKSDCGFPDFSRTELLLFTTFQGILFIFMRTKALQIWLLNAEISYTMYSSIWNTEWDSNFFNFELSDALCNELQEN